MLKSELSNDRAGLHKELGFLLFALLICGCTVNSTITGMTDVDEKFTREGWMLKCTDKGDSYCYTHQWFPFNFNEEVLYGEQSYQENSGQESGPEEEAGAN